MFSELPDNNYIAKLDYNRLKNATAFRRHYVLLTLWPDLWMLTTHHITLETPVTGISRHSNR
jgi:hypothetical protein